MENQIIHSKLKMNKQQIIKKTEEYVKKIMYGESTGHDWWHVYRIRKTAILIAKKENADRFIVDMAALLHDLDDWKFYNNSSNEPIKAVRWLKNNKVKEDDISSIIDIIKNISFKGGTVKSLMTTIEGKVIQDADRLDALGAIGIARAFAYGGSKNCGIKIEPTNYNDYIINLEKALVSLIKNKKERIRMGKNGRKRIIAEFSLTAVEKKIINVYNEVLAKKSNL
jgi:uncharacterized protein